MRSSAPQSRNLEFPLFWLYLTIGCAIAPAICSGLCLALGLGGAVTSHARLSAPGEWHSWSAALGAASALALLAAGLQLRSDRRAALRPSLPMHRLPRTPRGLRWLASLAGLVLVGALIRGAGPEGLYSVVLLVLCARAREEWHAWLRALASEPGAEAGGADVRLWLSLFS